MKEAFIHVKKDSSITVDPTVDTRYVILVSGDRKGSFTVKLTGAKRHIQIVGVIMGNHDGKIDFLFAARHCGKNTKSTIKVTAFAAGSSNIFAKIDVLIEKKTFGSSTDVSCRTLRLSDETRIRSLPILRMDHENLTASHAVVIDGFDTVSLGYLLSRGIPLCQARKILAFGMFRASVENVSDPVIRQTLYDEWEKFI